MTEQKPDASSVRFFHSSDRCQREPRSIYHRTKLEAERILQTMACSDFEVRVLRMARSFPEPGNVMAAYRLRRGAEVRDVADAHAAALTNSGNPFQRHIISTTTPFEPEDCASLATDAVSVIRLRAPALAAQLDRASLEVLPASPADKRRPE